MNHLFRFLLFLSLVLPSFAQIQHFPTMKWRETQTDHFTIRTNQVSPSKAKRNAEKVWEICARVLPGFTEEFANNTFETPDGEPGSEEAPYRYTIYLVKELTPFMEMVNQVAETMPETSKGFKKVCEQTRMFPDAQRRYVVICMADRPNGLDPLLVHSVASSLLSGHGRMAESAFFHTAGFGYYCEHLIFRKCQVHYVDFTQYYQNAEVVRGTALDAKSAWPRPVRRMVKKGTIEPNISDLFNLEIANMSPPKSGMLFALSHFMCHSEENVKKHHSYIEKLRQGEESTKELLLECYGFDNDSAFNAAVKEYITSRDFR